MNFSVRWSKQNKLSKSQQDGICHLHGPRANLTAQHADSHDGQHVRARDRAERKGMGETGRYTFYKDIDTHTHIHTHEQMLSRSKNFCIAKMLSCVRKDVLGVFETGFTVTDEKKKAWICRFSGINICDSMKARQSVQKCIYRKGNLFDKRKCEQFFFTFLFYFISKLNLYFI